MFIPFSFIGCENKNKETLATPNILEIKGGTIVFDPINNADYYTLSINDFTLTLDVKTNNNVEIIDNKINFDASNIFVVGNSYSVRLKANASKHYNSAFSSAYSYKHNGNIEKPTNLKINGSVLTWDIFENASYYVVKVITPNDTIIFDKTGNILEEDDPESISKADLTEYTFNTNQFDFSSLLSEAGNYKFYVSAVLSAGSNFVESGYAPAINHTHYVKLETPQNGTIKKVGNNVKFLTTIDPKANAITVECNGVEKHIDRNTQSQAFAIINDNLLEIDLTQVFANDEKINLNDIAQFAVRVQAKHLTNSPENAYYINSNYSDFVYFNNSHTLSAPNLTLSQDLTNNCFVANWTCLDSQLVQEYKLIVCLDNEVKEYSIDANINSKLIYGDFIAVAVKAVGYGNYKSSNFSNFASNPTLANTLNSIDTNQTDLVLTWNDVADYYIVEFASNFYVTDLNTYTIDASRLEDNDYSITLTAIKEGCQHKTISVNSTFSNKLETPTFGYGQGFTGSNLYELTFTGVDNAIGYYVYLKTKGAADFEKIDNLYLTTTIDLTKYICSEGNYTDYEVKVQAVADINGLFSNSNLSKSVNVSHVQVLDKPSFYKINDTITPVTKTILGNTTKYTLKFYGVENASSYEILINYNKISVKANNSFYTGIYEVDISNYLIAANNYEIKVRALPASSAINVQSSDYSVANYILTKQLPMVENIKVTENEGIYTLSFTPVDNAAAYRVRIIKENDSNYLTYLNSLGLTNTFVVTQSVDVTQYLVESGTYYFYVTALAPTQNSFYADSTESSTYGCVSKLKTLNSPSEIKYANLTKDEYTLSWVGDDNADYYLVKITNPNNIEYEFKVINSTTTNINQYVTVQGTYQFSIYSMVNALGENAKEFTSSPATHDHFTYIYNKLRDFERYSVYMYGSLYDFAIDNVNDLKNLLWYHYLYEIDQSTSLRVWINTHEKEDNSTETIKEAILRLAEEANNSLLHNFNNDEQWLAYVAEETTNDKTLFAYLCTKLLLIYPEFNVLENEVHVEHTTADDQEKIFSLYYRNALNIQKVNPTTQTFTNNNFGNEYKYIDLYSRRSVNAAFNIDSREEMLVTTTEQLLQAVQHNRKPKFVGDSGVAENVYNNAKLVLSAIATNNMSNLDKVTAIFNWLSASYDLTYYSILEKSYLTGALEKDNIQDYGLSKIYYLEGIFEDISVLPNGDIKIGSNLATSWSYSKAFALLCAIEGIEAVVVNGSYTYYDLTLAKDVNIDHVWNKVYIDTSVAGSGKCWYSVDLTFSDNRVNFNNLAKGYGMSSHSYFLTTDTFAELNLKVTDENYIVSSDYQTNKACKTNYNYYSNTSFNLSLDEIEKTITDFKNSSLTIDGFEYSLEFSSNEQYQKYSKTTGYGALQSFLLNAMIFAEFNADNNENGRSMFEFKFNIKDNNNSHLFELKKLQEIFDTCQSNYNLKLKLVLDPNNAVYTVEDGETKTTTVVFIVEKTA